MKIWHKVLEKKKLQLVTCVNTVLTTSSKSRPCSLLSPGFYTYNDYPMLSWARKHKRLVGNVIIISYIQTVLFNVVCF